MARGASTRGQPPNGGRKSRRLGASQGDPASIQESGKELSREAFYIQMAHRGLSYGAPLRVVQRAWVRPGEALGRLGVPEELARPLAAAPSSGRFSKVAFRSFTPCFRRARRIASLGFAGREWHALPPPNSSGSRAWRGPRQRGKLCASLSLVDDAGQIVLQIEELSSSPWQRSGRRIWTTPPRSSRSCAASSAR
ncbi:polyketide synthase dehydratase domain-containing protein [Nannocystis pusilla]|uniref:polyketide synthase dehydratase domain-containing protein n=1 Tax=Nannocystis pusilla TaxID=889268 RepID=UPI003B7C97CA